ncbi:MAG: M18 family aminopeptidase, partial [Congregibacter sp.]|nr:M18 family aminopeptidase [Congregibacter sp.]
MNREKFNTGLLEFLGESTTPFHAVQAMAQRLLGAGFEPLNSDRRVEPGGAGVFFTHAGSLIALRPGSDALSESGLRMVGAHTDSPCLMVKPQPELANLGYLQLGIEVYGGALLNPWFDRDLSLAGRVSYLNADGAVATALVDFRDPIAVVPSLAIHLDREANNNRAVNAQTQMAPLLSLGTGEGFSLRELLRERLLHEQSLQQRGVKPLAVKEVLDYELCFYDTQPPAQIGLQGEFIASARLDNLLSCYTGLEALIEANGSQWSLLVCNDHEEVGSRSASGAAGPMLQQFIRSLLPDSTALAPLMRQSMMISADNAHA